MDVVEATIAITVEWLCQYKPVVFTNRSKDQPRMADPFPIYQQVVKDNEAFFRDVHGYVPLSNTKTGLAGVRSRVYTKVWRDKVILPALRIYRARTEGASLDTVPEVTFSQKPSCDGRADKSVAQRGIMGFEPRSARIGYVYNPDRNPSLLDMPPSESDQDASRLLWEEDLRDDELENEYFMALQAHLDALDATLDATVSTAEKTQKRKEYMCSRCAGVPKKGHICPKASPSKKRKGCSSVRADVKRMRK
jgi:hypothetical protein